MSDFDRSLAFYRELLRPLGYVRASPVVGERGEHVVYLGKPARGPSGAEGSVSFRAAQSTPPGVPYDRYAVGIHHIAFGCPSREVVDERGAWLARQEGIEVLSPPREHDYVPGYYAVFFADFDGLKIELVHKPR